MANRFLSALGLARADATRTQQGPSTLPAPLGSRTPPPAKMMSPFDAMLAGESTRSTDEMWKRAEMPMSRKDIKAVGDAARKIIKVGGLWFSPQEVSAGKHIVTRKMAGLPDLTPEQLRDIEAQMAGKGSASSAWEKPAAISETSTYTERGKKVVRHGPKGQPMYARIEDLEGVIHEFPTHAELSAWQKARK